MPTFTWTPDHGAKRSVEPRVSKAQFGDGYTQRVKKGINNALQEWSLSFTLRTKAEVSQIEDFLEARGGAESFTWTTPKGQTLKFVCVKWESDYTHDGDCSLTCSFEQVP